MGEYRSTVGCRESTGSVWVWTPHRGTRDTYQLPLYDPFSFPSVPCPRLVSGWGKYRRQTEVRETPGVFLGEDGRQDTLRGVDTVEVFVGSVTDARVQTPVSRFTGRDVVREGVTPSTRDGSESGMNVDRGRGIGVG